MSTKLAILTTNVLKDFIVNTLDELSLGFHFKLYIYSTFEDIPPLFSSIPGDFECVVTSGIFPAMIIKKSFPNTKKLITHFNSDDAGICRLFLQLFMENPNLDLSRIYGDFLDIIGIDLKDYLIREPKSAYTDMVDSLVTQMTLKDLYAIEKKQIFKHLKLHRSGRVDLSITRFSSIVEPLAQQGITAWVPNPSREYLKTVFEKILQDIAILHLEDNRPAAVNVVVATDKLNEYTAIPVQRCILLLQTALMDFCGSSTLDYILQPTHFGFEILTNRKTLAAYTEHFTTCRLHDYLKETLSFSVYIGYGIGNDIYQARVNAINAGQEASINLPGSYLINEKDELTGPLGNAASVTAATLAGSSVAGAAKKAGLSPLTVNKVLTAIRAMPNRQITAQELSLKLSITKRSANRYLSALLKADAIEAVDQKRATTKGRPEMVFEICEDF